MYSCSHYKATFMASINIISLFVCCPIFKSRAFFFRLENAYRNVNQFLLKLFVELTIDKNAQLICKSPFDFV